jgi:ERCC4-type nuclease
VDKREPANFRLPLVEMGFKERKLKAGDIIIGDMLVERKGSTQFVTDWFSGQLDWQIRNMFKRKKYRPAIIMEWEDLSKIMKWLPRLEKHLDKLNWRVLPIYKSDGREQTLAWIKEQVADLRKGKRLVRDGIVNPYKGSKREDKNAMRRTAAITALSRLPGIGDDRALKILNQYGTLSVALKKVHLWSKQVNGIGTKTVMRASKVINYRF